MDRVFFPRRRFSSLLPWYPHWECLCFAQQMLSYRTRL